MIKRIRTSLTKNMTPSRLRFLLNLYGPYRGARIKVNYFSNDWRKASVSMKLTPLNRNYVGTQFGGSLYSMIDPHYMFMVMQNLGQDYIVWDKSARIEFIKPGKGTVHAEMALTEAIIDEIKAATVTGKKYLPTFTIDIVDDSGRLIAQVEKELYVRLKRERASKLTK